MFFDAWGDAPPTTNRCAEIMCGKDNLMYAKDAEGKALVGSDGKRRMCTKNEATAQANAPGRIQWKRLIPLVAACGLVMCAVALYQFGFRFTRGIPAEQAPPTLASPSSLTREKPDATPVPTDPTNSLTSDTLSHRFIPISSRGVLINSSSQGVIETKNGLREKLHLEFEDTYHWHDPGTGTNVRIFSPRSEELTVPLESY